MSASRKAVADALGIEEGEVRCENCKHGKRWINDVYMCSFWAMLRDFLSPDAFCTFFARKKDTP